MRRALPITGLALVALTSCAGASRWLGEVLRERPAAPLDSIGVASDARVDSSGFLVGSFVGEGTSRAVHLLSSDTAFIAALLRRYRPDLGGGDPWEALAGSRLIALGGEARRRTVAGSRPRIEAAVVGSPLGHTAVDVEAVLLRGGRRGCGPAGAQAELVVSPDLAPGEPPLIGPVLGSFRTGGATRERGLVRRDSVPAPSAGLTGELVGRTARALDSTLAVRHRALALHPDPDARIEINTLADLDAADVIAFRAAGSSVRYAVSLRVRRVSERGDTLVGAAVMVWDSAGAWQQAIFRPTLLALRRGRPAPLGAERPLWWRRLQPISDFSFARDALWMEQVDARDGRVLWGIVQPSGNVVVAAAEVDGPCR